MTTGLRPSEYLALKAGDFDRSRSTLAITRTLERTRGEWRFAGTKRPRSRRTVSLPAEVASLIARHIDSRELGCDRLLFESSTRGPVHERNLVQRAFKPLIARAGLPDNPVSIAPYLADTARFTHQYRISFLANAEGKPGMKSVKVTTEVPNAEIVAASKVYIPGRSAVR